MTYSAARARIVSVIEDTLPTDNKLVGEGRRFVHLVEGKAGIKCLSRSFWLEANVDGDGGITGPYTPDLQGQPRQTYSLTLTVSYQLHARRAVLDEVMASDLRLYSIALLNPAMWDRTTSGIHSLTQDLKYLPTRRSVGPESVEQRTFLSLWFS